MNGGVIGGQSRLASPYGSGVWVPDESNLEWAGIPFPTSGLVHYWPLTADANDTVGGGTNLTNNNGVTFSAEGAALVSASDRYLSATITMPQSFSWVFEFKVDSGKGLRIGSSTNQENGIGLHLPYTGGNTCLQTSKATTHQWSSRAVPFAFSTWNRCILTAGLDVDSRKLFSMFVPGATMPLPFLCQTRDAYTLSTVFAIGRFGSYVTDESDANVRNFRIYERVLTFAEIMRVMSV